MKTVSVSYFKTHCLRLIEEVAKSGEPLQITKRGRPAVRVSTPDGAQPKTIALGQFVGTATITGDIVAPHPEEWGELS